MIKTKIGKKNTKMSQALNERKWAMCNLWGTSFIEDLETGLGKDLTKISQKLTFRHKKLTYDVIFSLIMTSSKSPNHDFGPIFAEAWFWKTLKEGDIMICVCGRKFSRKKKWGRAGMWKDYHQNTERDLKKKARNFWKFWCLSNFAPFFLREKLFLVASKTWNWETVVQFISANGQIT